ncbi:GCN5-related N-acetyltransferase [Arcticibacter svalbardensis MN12-7]|uniref:GCN5-related N-acetyltransferase n=1 Tax=Arcticibacter svalbardensis MN12-7 TaxID=1150600 RepID=R9GQ83_9SPHI|nr:GNAT family N-acetyltransferase [Arcticibacter svalbardensis]EOR93886.1 GCN5-related N-acetyltransferase [Arcticibacter svalbardensis MN12-7]
MSYIKITKRFQDLSLEQLYQILHLRNEVFIVEQNCAFQDIDHIDQQCHHFMLYGDGKLIAYARIVPAGVVYEEASIGRIITHLSVRGTGVGIRMMDMILSDVEELLGAQPLRIGAQVWAQKFYEKFGFVKSSEIYDEDGIDHIKMIRKS